MVPPMTKLLIPLLTLSLLCASDSWKYNDNGTKEWGHEAPTCDQGKAQSPINIISTNSVITSHTFELTFHEKLLYKANIIDNGHSIKVTPQRPPYITLNEKDYVLLQFHYHGKSEHSVDGKFYDLVVHGVFENKETKELAVIAIFYEEGKVNRLLQKVLKNVGKSIFIPKILLPKSTEEYYHYVGSLTTPPCSENVQWYILKKPEEASKEQIEAMRKYHVNNFRPIQELNNRVIDAH